jgi:pimeloyl-ACP methyl ester carboxylesterase
MKEWLKKRWWLIKPIIILLIFISFAAWALIIPSPMAEALAATQSNSQVNVTTDPWLVFQPTEVNPTTGLIFYPGGKVDPRAYAPMAQEIAKQGYLVVIVPMPFNLAVFGANRAASVIQAYPEIQHWVIGGHSLGGSMAAAYADKHDEQIDGVILLASYPASSNSLVENNIEVTSIYGTQDGLATGEKIDASRPLLPADTTWVQINGGNHAQFGWYGDQSGDQPATISREDQQSQVLQAVLDTLKTVEHNSP